MFYLLFCAVLPPTVLFMNIFLALGRTPSFNSAAAND